jgi:hypothetical protein
LLADHSVRWDVAFGLNRKTANTTKGEIEWHTNILQQNGQNPKKASLKKLCANA